jgi:hypothetical protein
MGADREGARKKLLYNFRFGIRGDVEIFRRLAAGNVAHATASKVRDMAVLAQTRHDLSRRLFHRQGSFHLMGRISPNRHLSCERRRLRSIAPICTRALTLPKRMNNKQNDGNGDAGIGDIKRGPGVRVWNVQIKKEEIDHVPVKKAISKISQDASEQERERHIAPNIG